MSPVSVMPIFVLFCLAGGVIYLLLRFVKIDLPTGRFASIDGLRGVLAFCVFLHHSVIWFYFQKKHEWLPPPSRVYNHFGPGSVAMFFMITSFLFYTKLLEARNKGIDWAKLYTSRIYRIMPLYIFALIILFVIAGLVTNFTLHESPLQILGEYFQWLFFIAADINGIFDTKMLVAGVVWSLAFEWLFYCSLALIGKMVFRIRTPIIIMITATIFFVVFLMIILYFYPDTIIRWICPFAGGIAAAFLVKNSQVRNFCSGGWASALLLLMIPAILLFYTDLSKPVPFVGICIVFIIIAAGNDIFGLLSHRLTRYLGLISYSLYLLHGLVLFICFRFVVGYKKAGGFSPMEHWLVIGCCSIFLILACTLTYLYIEKPGQAKKNPHCVSGDD